MLYPKNVPQLERGARIILGVILLWFAFFGTPLIGAVTPLGAMILVASAVFIAVTGFIGWCPACALVGRKLKQNQTAKGHE